MSRKSHVWGRRAASVINPSGGAGQRAPAASQAGPKLQNDFGLKSGKTRRIFVDVNVSFASLSVGQRCRSESAKLYNGGINDVPFQRKSSLFWIVFMVFFALSSMSATANRRAKAVRVGFGSDAVEKGFA